MFSYVQRNGMEISVLGTKVSNLWNEAVSSCEQEVAIVAAKKMMRFVCEPMLLPLIVDGHAPPLLVKYFLAVTGDDNKLPVSIEKMTQATSEYTKNITNKLYVLDLFFRANLAVDFLLETINPDALVSELISDEICRIRVKRTKSFFTNIRRMAGLAVYSIYELRAIADEIDELEKELQQKCKGKNFALHFNKCLQEVMDQLQACKQRFVFTIKYLQEKESGAQIGLGLPPIYYLVKELDEFGILNDENWTVLRKKLLPCFLSIVSKNISDELPLTFSEIKKGFSDFYYEASNVHKKFKNEDAINNIGIEKNNKKKELNGVKNRIILLTAIIEKTTEQEKSTVNNITQTQSTSATSNASNTADTDVSHSLNKNNNHNNRNSVNNLDNFNNSNNVNTLHQPDKSNNNNLKYGNQGQLQQKIIRKKLLLERQEQLQKKLQQLAFTQEYIIRKMWEKYGVNELAEWIKRYIAHNHVKNMLKANSCDQLLQRVGNESSNHFKCSADQIGDKLKKIKSALFKHNTNHEELEQFLLSLPTAAILDQFVVQLIIETIKDHYNYYYASYPLKTRTLVLDCNGRLTIIKKYFPEIKLQFATLLHGESIIYLIPPSEFSPMDLWNLIKELNYSKNNVQGSHLAGILRTIYDAWSKYKTPYWHVFYEEYKKRVELAKEGCNKIIIETENLGDVNVIYQILTSGYGYTMRYAAVTVCESLTGKIRIVYKGKSQHYKCYNKQQHRTAEVVDAKEINQRINEVLKVNKPNKPGKDHPWRVPNECWLSNKSPDVLALSNPL